MWWGLFGLGKTNKHLNEGQSLAFLDVPTPIQTSIVIVTLSRKKGDKKESKVKALWFNSLRVV